VSNARCTPASTMRMHSLQLYHMQCNRARQQASQTLADVVINRKSDGGALRAKLVLAGGMRMERFAHMPEHMVSCSSLKGHPCGRDVQQQQPF
jgi:hypothetical protein